MVKLRQTNAAGGNAADIAQYVKQALGPGTPDEGNEEELEPNAPSTRSTSTQKQESHQVVHLQQISTSGNNSAPIVQSLRQNANAALSIDSVPGVGMKVHIFFARAAAAP